MLYGGAQVECTFPVVGGFGEKFDLNLSSVPLLWMENEAELAGLRLRPRETGGAWNLEELKRANLRESLKGFWWSLLEYCPVTHLSFETADGVTRWAGSLLNEIICSFRFRLRPHKGAGRVIAPGQLVHISVAFKSKNYIPRATFRDNVGIKWKSFVGKEIGSSDFVWTRQLAEKIEMDLLDPSFTTEAVQKLKELWGKGDSTATADESGHDENYRGEKNTGSNDWRSLPSPDGWQPIVYHSAGAGMG